MSSVVNGQDIDITKDAGPYGAVRLGIAGAAFTSADAHAAPVAVTDAPSAAQSISVLDLKISTDTAMTVSFTEETSGTLKARYYVPALGSVPDSFRGLIRLAAGKRLMVQTSVAGNIAISPFYNLV